jgi:hypothetical protein
MEAIRKDRLIKWGFENADVRGGYEDKAQRYIDLNEAARNGRRLLYAGCVAYVVAVALVGYLVGTGGL